MDLETLVSVCGGSSNGRKITCETLADNTPENFTAASSTEEYVPPESFWLSKDAEFDWFDRNAFLERKESTKGNSNSATNSNPNHSNSNSQRFVSNLKSKAAILGLPKTQKTNFVVDSKRRQCIKLFPKRPDSVGKTTGISMAEPSSPKVSCMGRVRSKRGRKKPAEPVTESKKPELQKIRSLKMKKPAVLVTGPKKPELRTSRSLKMKKPELQTSLSMKKTKKTGNKSVKKKSGILSRLTSMFGSDGQRQKSNKRSGRYYEPDEPAEESAPRRSVTVNKTQEYSAGSGPAAEPPSIGAMTRFVSGRRSDGFGTGDADVSSRDSLDLRRRGV